MLLISNFLVICGLIYVVFALKILNYTTNYLL